MSHHLNSSLNFFKFNEASSDTHTIVHNLGTLTVDVEVINNNDDTIFYPNEILIVDLNTIEITLLVPLPIRGIVIGAPDPVIT